jgi:hypothetical protein
LRSKSKYLASQSTDIGASCSYAAMGAGPNRSRLAVRFRPPRLPMQRRSIRRLWGNGFRIFTTGDQLRANV